MIMSILTMNQSVYGKLYYDTGELKYEGYYSPTEYDAKFHEPNGRGTYYYKKGIVYREGQFQHGGLLEGKEYYPSGKLKFEGRYNCRATDGGYYGPSYPVCGKFFSEQGLLLYDGIFKIAKQGNVGYPKVIYPEGFGSLT